MVHHRESLSRLKGKLAEQAGVIEKNWHDAELTDREEVLLEFSENLTRHPNKGRKEAMVVLREKGLTDEEILHLVEVIGYFNFVNRLAEGLLVELEVQE